MKFVQRKSGEVTAEGLEIKFERHTGEDRGTAGAPF